MSFPTPLALAGKWICFQVLFAGEFCVNDNINYCGNHMHIVMQIAIDMLLWLWHDFQFYTNLVRTN